MKRIKLILIPLTFLFIFTIISGFSGNLQDTLSGQESEKGHSLQTDESVLIYSSHNREAYLSNLEELEKNSEINLDENNNISLVNDYLVNSLKEKNVNVIQTKEDYYLENNGDYAGLYELSRKTIKKALSDYRNINMVFDIQMSSFSREKTTTEIDGEDTAKIHFVIDKKNSNWEKNLDFANQVHETMEQMYPGVSGGLIIKKALNSWNQDLMTNSSLIMIGGKENTFNEAYRAADILADVISSVDMAENNSRYTIQQFWEYDRLLKNISLGE